MNRVAGILYNQGVAGILYNQGVTVTMNGVAGILDIQGVSVTVNGVAGILHIQGLAVTITLEPREVTGKKLPETQSGGKNSAWQCDFTGCRKVCCS
jgi:hypothetical protein